MFKAKAATQPCILLTGETVKPVVDRTRKARERDRAADIRLLYQLAADYDAISPNVAARLRDIARRH